MIQLDRGNMKDEELKCFTVYMHRNKINGKKYIGITRRNPNNRWKHNGGGYSTQYFYKDIQKYGWDNFEHIILKDNLSEQEALKLESEFIETYQTLWNQNGYNVRKASGYSCIKDGRHIYQFDIYGNFIREYKKITDASEEMNIFISNIVAACTGAIKQAKGYIWRYKEDVDNVDGFYKTIDSKDFEWFYPIYQFTLDQKFVHEYENVNDACSKNPSFYSSSIYDNCRGKTNHACGYIWRFKKDIPSIQEFENTPIKIVKYEYCNPVIQFDLDGNYIQEFKSPTYAAIAMNCDSHTITYACSGRTSSGKGYLWKYKKDYYGGKIAPYIPYQQPTKQVAQYDKKTKKLINTFISAKEACEITGVPRGGIIATCNGEQKTSHGYIWRYIELNEAVG